MSTEKDGKVYDCESITVDFGAAREKRRARNAAKRERRARRQRKRSR